MCEDMDINAINAKRNAFGEESIEEPERSEKTRINLYNWQLFYFDGIYSVEVDEDDLFKHVTALQITGQDELKVRAKEDDDRILETVRRYDNSIYLEVSDADNPRKLAYHINPRWSQGHRGCPLWKDCILQHFQVCREENRGYCFLIRSDL